MDHAGRQLHKMLAWLLGINELNRKSTGRVTDLPPPPGLSLLPHGRTLAPHPRSMPGLAGVAARVRRRSRRVCEEARGRARRGWAQLLLLLLLPPPPPASPCKLMPSIAPILGFRRSMSSTKSARRPANEDIMHPD